MVIRFCTQFEFDFDFVELRFATVLHLPHIPQLADVKKINCFRQPAEQGQNN
jgi:hypothetical protein